MKFLDTIRFRLATLFRRSQINAEMEEELRAHVRLRAEDLERSGLSRAEAERQARLEFGGHARFKEECHEAAGGTLIESVLQDVRFGFRMLRKSPGFAAIAIATLALGIGANVVVFSVLNAFILHPLNITHANTLYGLERSSDKLGFESYPNYLDLRARNRTFDVLAAFNIAAGGLDAGGNPSLSWMIEASGNYFETLHVQPYLGRLFDSSDERGPNSAPYIVLTYPYWHSQFHDDPGVIGRSVQLNKHPFTIIGVSPPEFHGTIVFFFPDFFVPIVNQEQIDADAFLNSRGSRRIFEVIGHLKAGVTPSEAVADLNSIGADLERTYPKDDGNMRFALSRPSLYGDALGPAVKAFLTGLMLLAALILLAACANLGGLFAARAADRSRELALRVALGSSRLRILRQLFTEALMVSLIGGAVGMWVSIVLLDALSVWQPSARYPFHVPVNPGASVYGIALLLAVASGFLFGAVPVRQILRTDPYEIVKSGSIATFKRRISVRDLLLGFQLAICAVLVTSSLVAVRGMLRSLRGNFGFEPRNAMLVTTVLDMAGYRGDAVPAMQKRVLETIEAIPGVTSVGLVNRPPLVDRAETASVFSDQAADLTPSSSAATPTIRAVSPGYFHAAATPLLAGREFTWQDDKTSPRVAVINQVLARKLFGSETGALGEYFKLQDGSRVQVVGISEDGKYDSLTDAPGPAILFPFLQATSSTASLIVRSNLDSEQLSKAVRSAVRSLDSGLPVYTENWFEAMDTNLFPSRMAAASLSVLGVMGAMLSVTGIFGLAAYSVSKRKRELGIRIALGARRREVLEAALGRALKLLAIGSASGLLLGILATRVLASIVYEATPRDPLVLAGVVLAMMFLGLLATWIPAQRALSIDPSMLMREE